ncbi:DUF4349 domain-containing protein [Agrococcus sp. DT81.2]|uniref:DUF4349 domain-containing protein n=1 Tax=Agrococcus sp. DT81.2 TaxID=3393414 RepID=UPI003CE5BE07
MTRRLLSTAGIVIAGAVLLTGCGAMGASQSQAPGIGMPAPATDGGGLPEWAGEPESAPFPGEQESSGGASGGDTGASDTVPAEAADEDRAVIISGSLAMRVGDPIEMADAVSDAAQSRGGSIDRRAEGASTDFQPAWAMLTVRVPAQQVQDLLSALRALGDVTNVDLGEEVVTNQVRDLEVRVNASRASVERLTTLLTTAADTETLLEVEAQLTQRTSELEQLLSQQRTLTDQVAMSTIEVRISSTSVEGPTGTPSFWDGLVAGWSAFLAWGAVALFGLGQALPTLVILALLALVAWLVGRRVIKRLPGRTRGSTSGAAVTNPATTAPVE